MAAPLVHVTGLGDAHLHAWVRTTAGWHARVTWTEFVAGEPALLRGSFDAADVTEIPGQDYRAVRKIQIERQHGHIPTPHDWRRTG